MIRRLFKHMTFILSMLSLTVIMSACSTQFAEGEPYYYELIEVNSRWLDSNMTGQVRNNMYTIDPFEGNVLAYDASVDNTEELPYKLEEYTDTEEELIIHYENDQSDHFKKKSDSLWKSLETEIEYSVEKIDGEFDYTKVERP